MKANEAPEKLYLHPTAKGKVGASWLTFPLTNEDIEYIRKNAFIEKAKKWLNQHYRDYMYNPTGKRLEAFFGMDMVNDFENYMEKEL